MEISFQNLPTVVLNKVMDYLDVDSLVSLEKTNHAVLNIVSSYWQKYCKKMGLSKDPTPLCVAWKVNPLSLYSYENAVRLCEDPTRKWRLMAIRDDLRKNYKCLNCKEWLRDICGVNGIYFEHDILLCTPECYNFFTLYVRNDVV